MKIYLQNIVNSLKQYSESLDKQTLLINKPWALIDSELGIQKLIFKKDKELILSRDGQVVMGKWDYFPEAKCLLIDRGTDKILCNEAYIDDSILVLKQDGKKGDFFILANENNIPDLDVYEYLRKLFYKKYGIQNTQLVDDRFLQISPNYYNSMGLGSSVTIDDTDALNGSYFTKDGTQKIYVEENKINRITYPRKYKLDNGDYIVIEQESINNFEVGCPVIINNQLLKNDVYLLEYMKIKLYVIDNVITEIFYIKQYNLSNEEPILIEQKTDYLFELWDKVYIYGLIAKDGKYKIKNNSSISIQNGFIKKIGLSSESKSLYILFLIISIGAIIYGLIKKQ